MLKSTLEEMLEAELTDHLGYTKYSPQGKNTGKSRNGKTPKTIKNDNGQIDLEISRDCNGSFDPIFYNEYRIVESKITLPGATQFKRIILLIFTSIKIIL